MNIDKDKEDAMRVERWLSDNGFDSFYDNLNFDIVKSLDDACRNRKYIHMYGSEKWDELHDLAREFGL